MSPADVKDEHWEEKHRNDSRRWLTDYSQKWVYKSSTKTDYKKPEAQDELINVGIRRKTERAKLWVEQANAYLKELEIKPPNEEYCTTYDTEYKIPGFEVKEITEEKTELHEKYPLYKSNCLTCYQQIVNDNINNPAPLGNMTKIQNSLNPFRRSYAFSKHISERYDDPE